MNDFVDDLERELLAAARRRTAAARGVSAGWRRVLGARGVGAAGRGRPRAGARRGAGRVGLARGGAVLVALAALAAVLTLVVRPAPAPETPATRGTSLPAPAAPADCRGPMTVTAHGTPDAILREFAVLRREPRRSDALPGGALGWLPIGNYGRDAARRVGDVLLVPTDRVLDRSTRCGAVRDRGPGVCLVTEKPTAGLCFTLDEILAGRAFELDSGWVTGLVPDSWGQVEFGIQGTRTRLPVSANVVREEFGGLRPGDAFTATRLADPPRILLINETQTEGLAAATRDELRAALGDMKATFLVDRSPRTNRHRTTIDSVRRTTIANPIAQTLRTGYTTHETEPADPGAPDVIVRLGSDRMR
ncbi:hypothetical protein [Solirubrobacter soli]|uniref:hypothetical protein n=1 Tax=Solirubrobacter soli TaxID=363832 RepID=UPI0003FA0F24|nr:hypothetical protein [Solirubrobacter soli]